MHEVKASLLRNAQDIPSPVAFSTTRPSLSGVLTCKDAILILICAILLKRETHRDDKFWPEAGANDSWMPRRDPAGLGNSACRQGCVGEHVQDTGHTQGLEGVDHGSPLREKHDTALWEAAGGEALLECP